MPTTSVPAPNPGPKTGSFRPETVLVIGASGQLGYELTQTLRDRYGVGRVVAADVRTPRQLDLVQDGPFELLDVLDRDGIARLMQQYRFTQIYHLAAILSAVGEAKPHMAWDLNMNGLLNVLEAAREFGVGRVYWPSSIAVFGPNTPRDFTPQNTIMDPNTVYGFSKLAGERWCDYYFRRWQLDVRSLRYPGLIGYKTLPGGGTTDYAVDIYHKAVAGEEFSCFLKPGTTLPMMYMPDAIRATLDLMHADADKLTVRSSYNLAGMSFAPEEIAAAIQLHLPKFQISYAPDPTRQAIAESWPRSIDDSVARADWGWTPEFDLVKMTADMLAHLPALV